ncbi:hypothetical protein BK126_16970 [Paenibacillus sp. FSL H7-0326]|uniref:hypothetical protein n=1 Tax=Paenibacillus sp. FSL H7-0326 TaxID=1921144 RepID=UPI00096D037A|nr:hypothetical protein [Paenibacillus sp. FSL H7-0326]OMC67297.1 hypothetical protein BK126_16970 [Paenibacillus sp. FSL H7-0326]
MLKFTSHKKSVWKWTFFFLLLLLSWVWNLAYYNSMQLDKPLFPKQYMTAINQLTEIKVYYLENKDQGKKVSQIHIKELPHTAIGSPTTQIEYDYQNLKRFYIDLRPEENTKIDTEQDKDIVIREIEVYYDDGSTETVPIGEIVVRPYPEKGYVTDMGSSGASSDGSGHDYLSVVTKAWLTKVEMTHTEELSSLIDYTLYGKPADQVTYPKEVVPDDRITLRYQWKLPEDPSEFMIYEALALMHFNTPEDKEIVDFSFMINNLSYSEEQIRSIVQEVN